jgi:hypothetical protein
MCRIPCLVMAPRDCFPPLVASRSEHFCIGHAGIDHRSSQLTDAGNFREQLGHVTRQMGFGYFLLWPIDRDVDLSRLLR